MARAGGGEQGGDPLRSRFGLDGRRAFVTGASSGMGRAIAVALAEAGAEVVLVARRAAHLAAAVDEIAASGGRAHALAADLSRRDEVARATATAAERHGEPDILVTAAAVNHRPPLDDLTLDQWDETNALNLDAPFLLGQRFGPRMAERGWGRIVHIASQQSVRAFGNSGAYGVSKAAVVGLTRSQAEAWSARGVCCNAVSPGFVRTPLTEPAFAVPGRAEALAARTMAGRNGTPDDVTGLVIFLAGPSAAYLTGQLIFCDGGFSVH
jgi:NAD(P)-dependent dehydrogenase (short-subunit alcohol dehydrogenase family)